MVANIRMTLISRRELLVEISIQEEGRIIFDFLFLFKIYMPGNIPINLFAKQGIFFFGIRIVSSFV